MNLHNVPTEISYPVLTTLQKLAIIGIIEAYRNNNPITIRVVKNWMDSPKPAIQYQQFINGYNGAWRSFIGNFGYWATDAKAKGYTVKDFSFEKYVSQIV